MFLSSTSDIIRVVTGSAVSNIEVHTDWVDNASGTYTPGRTNTEITTATTTTIVASPGASTVRNVKGISIENNSTASSSVVTVQHYDGTTSVDVAKVTLRAGEVLELTDDGEWQHLTSYGAEYEYDGRTNYQGLGITGTIAESIPRHLCPEANLAILTSGTLRMVGVYLRAGQVVTNISFCSATTAAGTPTNQFFALYDRECMKLAETANNTTTAWAANTIKTLALTSPYTVPISAPYLIGIMVTATTVPTLKGISRTSGIIISGPAVIGFNSTSGLTTSLPASAFLSTTGLAPHPWAAIT